jgi:uncharacterized MnhB-related membrane protein
MTPELVIDFILAGGVLILAWLALAARQLFTGIVLYISLGLLVTLVWVRLEAWDVAIAEVAIGAGLTGALLLVAWHRLRDDDETTTVVSESTVVTEPLNDVS